MRIESTLLLPTALAGLVLLPCCGGGSSNVSNNPTVTPDTTAPTVPADLTGLRVSSTQIDLSWIPSTDETGVSGYWIYRDGTRIATSTTPTYSDTPVLADDSYSYTVAAFDVVGNVSAQSEAVTVTNQVASNNAEYVGCDVPTALVTDQVFQAKITFRNSGTTTWGQEEGQTAITLVSKGPDFNSTWGTYFIIQGQGSSVAPGDTFTFTSYLMAPSTPGDYAFSWQCQNWIPIGGQIPDLASKAFIGAIATGPAIHVSARTEQPPAHPAHQDGLLDHDDLEYAGSFLLPGISGEEDVYTDSGLALRSNGNTKQLLLWTGTYHSRLYEVSVPALVKITDQDYSSAQTAGFVRDWGLLDYGTLGGEVITATGGMYLDEATNTLYWTHYNWYFCGGPGDFPELLATRLNTDGTQTNAGYWYLPSTPAKYKSYWGGVTKLSSDFAQTYTGGRDLALGFGGYFSICGSASRGPALGAIARPGISGSTLDLVEMMTYPDPIACPRDGNYFSNIGYWSTQPPNPWTGSWTGQDFCRSGVFIDLPDKKGYLAFAGQGIGRLGYDYGGYNSDGHYQQCWYFYDIHDLGAAAQGAVSETSITPASYDVAEYPLKANVVSGACFDPETRMLYLYVTHSLDNNRPIIHVYHIK